MVEIVWNQAYSPAEAERGKFVAIDSSTITNYPTSGRGKYADIVTSITTTTVDGFSIPTYDTVIYGYTGANKVSSETFQISGNTVAQIYKYYDTNNNLISAVQAM